MNSNGAFVLWLTAMGVLSQRDAHAILQAGREFFTGARWVALAGFTEFEATRNRSGGVEFQGLLGFGNEGADLADASQDSSFFPAPRKARGRKSSAQRVESSGEGSRCGVTVAGGAAGPASGVSGEGVRASGASFAPQCDACSDGASCVASGCDFSQKSRVLVFADELNVLFSKAFEKIL
jgi:hypothetical protein